MVCTRCGAVQRRASARFCHECGATFELAPTNVQPDTPERPAQEAAPQYPPSIRPGMFTPPEDEENTRLQEQRPPERQLSQPPPTGYPNWLDEAPTALRTEPAAWREENSSQPSGPSAPPSWSAAPNQEQAASPFGNQPEPFSPPANRQAFALENQQWPPAPPVRGPRSSPPAWIDEPPAWERQPQAAFPPARNAPNAPNQKPFDERAEPPLAPWQTPPAERPSRGAAARGPVPGAFQRSRPVKRRRLPLGVLITLGLILVFVLAGVGIYAFANGSGSQEPAAFKTYKDPSHFSIQYPTVWKVKKLSNGVQFSDVTNTVALSVTYIPNTSNLSATAFANQEAAKENISTPDSQTFAGTTWVQRSGIVTQTSGISQDIFIFVAASNNLLYEVREVAPLDGYKEPNQAAFMRMLQSLELS